MYSYDEIAGMIDHSLLKPTLTEKEVIDFARLSLTNYKVPKHVEFRAELPKTNVGKILRRALRE